MDGVLPHVYVKQDWNARAVVRLQENTCATTKRRSWNAGALIETRFDVTSILKVGWSLQREWDFEMDQVVEIWNLVHTLCATCWLNHGKSTLSMINSFTEMIHIPRGSGQWANPLKGAQSYFFSTFSQTFWNFGIKRCPIFFLSPTRNFMAKRYSLGKITVKMWLVMVTMI